MDFLKTRNPLDETAARRVNWLIPFIDLALTFWKGEPGFGIHTRIAAYKPDADTVVHLAVPSAPATD